MPRTTHSMVAEIACPVACPPDPLTPLLLESISRQLAQVVDLGAFPREEGRLLEMGLYLGGLAERSREGAELGLIGATRHRSGET